MVREKNEKENAIRYLLCTILISVLIIFPIKKVKATGNYDDIWNSFLSSSDTYDTHAIYPNSSEFFNEAVITPLTAKVHYNSDYNVNVSDCLADYSQCTLSLYKYNSGTYNAETVDSRVVNFIYEELDPSIIETYENYANEMANTLSSVHMFGVTFTTPSRYFTLDDLELFNRYSNSNGIRDHIDAILYDEEFNSLYNDPNLSFIYIPRKGDGCPFYTQYSGSLYYQYNGVIVSYILSGIGVLEAKVIYIPEDTEKTSTAYIAAAKKRIKDNLDIDANIEVGDQRSNYPFEPFGDFDTRDDLYASLGTDEQLGDYWYNVTFNGYTEEFLISANDNPSHNYVTSNSSGDPSGDPSGDATGDPTGDPSVNNETSLKIIAPSKFLKFGSSMHLSVLGISDSISNTDVIWESSNDNIVSVNSEGGISSARYTGIVTITATSKADSNLKDTITLYVGQNSVELGKKVTLGKDWYNGHSEAQWAIDDDSLFEIVNSYTTTVSGQAGTVYTHTLILKAIKSGYTKVSMNTITGDRIIDYRVYVHNPIKKIESDVNDLTIEKGDTGKLEVTITPDNVTEDLNRIIYLSEDPSIASIDQSGNINALKEGSTNLVVRSQYSDVSLTIPINVVIYTESLTLDSYNVSLNDDNRTHQIIYEVLPEDATNKNVTFESSDETVVTVSDTGLITAIKNGEANIAVKTEDGKQTKNIAVTVSGLRKDISGLDYPELNDYVYNGNAIIPTVSVYDDQYKLNENLDYVVSFTNNINAGTAEVLVEGIGNYKGSKQLTFKIKKAGISFSSGDVTVPYDGNEHGASLNVTTPNTIIKYADSNGEYTLDTMPTYKDSGTYVIRYQLSVDDNYTSIEGELTLTINKIDFVDNSTGTACLYDGNSHTMNLDIGTDDYSSEYRVISVDYNTMFPNNYTDNYPLSSTPNLPSFVNPGYYYVTYIVKKKNYNDYSGTVDVKIYGMTGYDKNSLKIRNNILIVKNYILDPNAIWNKFNILMESSAFGGAYDKNGVANINSVKTGDYYKITVDNNQLYSFQLSVLGDVNGDGKISALDYVKIKNHIMKTSMITSEVNLIAADLNEDQKISALDYVRIKNYIMNGGN